jgi:hypothetical protein
MALEERDEQLRENLSKKLGLSQSEEGLKLDAQSLLHASGGKLGIVESISPSLLFIAVFLTTKNATAAVIVALSCSVVFLIYRLIRRQALVQVLVGALVVGISAWFALRPGGDTRDFFLPDLITNAIYFVPLTVSILIRWPIVGLIMGFIRQEGILWRKDSKLLRRYSLATAVLASVFAIRLLVKVPLYISNDLTAMSLAKALMGVPMWAAALWICWLIVKRPVESKN